MQISPDSQKTRDATLSSFTGKIFELRGDGTVRRCLALARIGLLVNACGSEGR